MRQLKVTERLKQHEVNFSYSMV